jgi:copper chaperone CopZ
LSCPGGHREERALKEVRLAVQGMGCRRCVREVTGRLRDVPGVKTVAADISTRTVRLTGSMTDADILAALAGTTYIAEIQ